MSRHLAFALFAALIAGCHGGGSGTDQVDVRASGMAYVRGDLTGDVLLDAASVALPTSGEGLFLAVTLVINGEFAESGGLTCNEPDPIWISGSVSLSIGADGSYQASGTLPLRSPGGGGDVPGGCRERTGVIIDSFESVVLEARVQTQAWNDYEVWMGCLAGSYAACEGSADPNCPTAQTRACRDEAWSRTLWHRVTGAECIDGGTYCIADPGYPPMTTGLTAKVTLPESAMDAINDGFSSSGELDLSTDLVFRFGDQ